MEVPEDCKALFEKKLAKFDKFFKDDAVAYITLSRKHGKERLELTVSSGGTLFRGEEEAETFNNALDEAIESIERQIRKNKTRLEKRLREGAFVRSAGEPDRFADAGAVEEETEFNIRVKEFELAPMSPSEAILQMNLLDHSFFLFINDETGMTNVVYKRNDGDYGIIVPVTK